MSTVLDETIEKLEQEEEDLNFLQFGIKAWVNLKYSMNDNSLTPDEYERLVQKRSDAKQKMKEIRDRKMELIKVRNALIPVTTEKANEE